MSVVIKGHFPHSQCIYSSRPGCRQSGVRLIHFFLTNFNISSLFGIQDTIFITQSFRTPCAETQAWSCRKPWHSSFIESLFYISFKWFLNKRTLFFISYYESCLIVRIPNTIICVNLIYFHWIQGGFPGLLLGNAVQYLKAEPDPWCKPVLPILPINICHSNLCWAIVPADEGLQCSLCVCGQRVQC